MPLFMIKRKVPDATQEDVDAALFRAMACMFQFSGMKWLNTYWDRTNGQSYCVYEARDEEQIRAHASRAHIPCDEIWPVEGIDPSQYIAGSGKVTQDAPA